MNLVGIVGTNSDTSTNRKLLKFIAKHFASQAQIEVLEIRDLPAFDEPEDRMAPSKVASLSQKIHTADGMIIATPEYDHSIPAALKSVLEWLSYTNQPLIDKSVMIVGASHGSLGTSRAQLHLDAPGVTAAVMPGYEFLLGKAHEAFDEEGNLKSESTIDFLESCFLHFLRFTEVANLLNIPEELIFEPGDYSVSAVGHNGILPMKVELSTDRIESIDIDTSVESQGIADVVFKRIPSQIIEGQTLNVDILSGASVTSNGVLDGVAKAVKMAGANPDILRKRPKAPSAVFHGNEEYTTDVVVVGGAGAGLSDAATVLQHGKNVSSKNSRLSAGTLYELVDQ